MIFFTELLVNVIIFLRIDGKYAMTKSFKFLISCSIAMSLAMPAIAAKLPKPIVDYINNFDDVNIRFDGFVQLNNGSEYLPVFPIAYKETDTPAKVVKTIPKKISENLMPDLILFDNNFAFLRIIKKKGEKPTLIESNDIPIEVKMGLLPQDLIVPENLVIPEELQVILGDLKIPIKDWDKNFEYKNQYDQIVNFDQSKQVKKMLAKTTSKIKEFKNNVFYTTSNKSNFLQIIQPESNTPLKLVKLPSTPSDIKLITQGRYILASCMSKNEVAVIDTFTNKYVKQIKTGKYPSNIIIDNDERYGYVLNKLSSSISVIDLLNMKKLKDINVKGYPANLTIDEDNECLFYNDSSTGNVYRIYITTEDNYCEKITNDYNISCMKAKDNKLYITSRTKDTLQVYDLFKDKVIDTLKVDKKPVDIKCFDKKVYVLSAQSRIISVFDAEKTLPLSKIILKDKGFPNKIKLIPDSKKALITDIGSYEMELIDLAEDKVLTTLPVNRNINSLLIAEPVR